jgi:hypothetical protein
MFGIGTAINISERSISRRSLMEIVRNLSFACLALLMASVSAYAQSNLYRCEVSIADFNTDTGTSLGSFTTAIVKDKPITKAFRFPGTRLVITAGVLYMQESPYVEGAPPSKIILTLIIGKKEYPITGEGLRGTDVLSNARVALPLKSFEGARLETIFLEKREPVVFTLECKNGRG